MAKLKIKLSKNLRRSILRGHPWVYKDAFISPGPVQTAQLCQVLDKTGELAWGIYDPHSVLGIRILSLDKVPPGTAFLERQFARAYDLRAPVRASQTNAYRLFNGEGDCLPGLICDVYDSVAVLQFDGQGPGEFWDRDLVKNWILENTPCQIVVEKKRREHDLLVLSPSPQGGEGFRVRSVLENNVKFKINLEKGQKTGFFLDQRDNRNYIRAASAGKSVLNLFSYTGGFSVYAGLGGATRVASLDISKGALELAEENWMLNGLDKNKHTSLCVDVFEYLRGNAELWDHIIVDPPSMTHSKDQKDLAVLKYIEIFMAAAKRVRAGGELSLSSCSSHISFNDFLNIIEEALSGARRRGRVLRVSGQGPDHPFPHACPELRYLKFVHLALEG